jgi:heme-degrading monooxygenase HmoA
VRLPRHPHRPLRLTAAAVASLAIIAAACINVLTPTDGTQDDVVAALEEGLGQQVATFDGFISAAIHRSLDDDTVIVYAHWESQAAVEAIGNGDAPAMATAFTIETPDFHRFDVVSVNPAIAD